MSMLSEILMVPLNSLGTTIGLPSLGTWVNSFVNMVNQGEVNQTVLSDLSAIQTDLQNMNNEIANISQQIQGFETLYQEDTLAQYVTNINTFYSDILDIVSTTVSTQEDLSNIQSRLVAICNEAISDSTGILNNVNQISTLLISNPVASPGFMNTQNAALMSSSEFFSYCVGIHSIAVNYYTAYAQASFCVAWASELNAQNLINFPEAAAWTTSITTDITNLQDFLTDNVPASVQTLVYNLAQSTASPQYTNIWISPYLAQNQYVYFWGNDGFPPVGFIAAQPPNNDVTFNFYLVSAVDLSTPTVNTQYQFQLAFTPASTSFQGISDSGPWLTSTALSCGYGLKPTVGYGVDAFLIWTNTSGYFILDTVNVGHDCGYGISLQTANNWLVSVTPYDLTDQTEWMLLEPPPSA